MSTVEVSIMGQSYVLSCQEHERAALLEAVAEVDREMCSIRELGRIRARERIAVLAALNLAHAKLQAADAAPVAGVAPLDSEPLQQRLKLLQDKLDASLRDDQQLL